MGNFIFTAIEVTPFLSHALNHLKPTSCLEEVSPHPRSSAPTWPRSLARRRPPAPSLKLLWAYIKKNNLQDPDNKQYFIPDKKMAKVFGSDKMRGFGMAKHIGPHLS